MSLRLPNAPMEGLSIDVKKFASDASTFFNRARQYTEEQLGQAVKWIPPVEKTKLDEEVEELWNRFDVTNETIQKLSGSIEALLQPNPNLRYEKKILSKIDSGNQLGRPAEESQLQALGKVLEVSAVQMKPHNLKFSTVLGAVGDCELNFAKAEDTFIHNTKESTIRPFSSFLENDAKTIFKEKKSLETCRLDLDAVKAKLKKVKTLEMRDQVESELRAAQAEFMRQQELLKLLLENITSAQTTQLRSLVDFVNNQTTYLTTIASASKALQTQVNDLAGDLVSPGQNNQFPRKNSNSNNVPVTDILKDEK